MKVTIQNWHSIFAWHWDVPGDEVCGICRVAFDGTCPVCKFPGDQCPIGKFFDCLFCFVILRSHVGHVLTFCPAIGSCHHSFHMHCILKWLDTDTSKGLCPMCRQIFTLENSNNKEVFEALSGRPSPLEEGILEQEGTPV
ncbi:Catalytic core subunit of the Anaphase-Promoting Complex/Cyclosome (APC/C) [Komagataella phaffii GS115]|uniref:Anaphase-promoting complex subunit 11 n=1 Tax=Komagataella phaffii (strain GS115 / ATCC 20864) TaxID=644223 RepID=C4R449_KOMPG|nr:Catalytic core subunit of the Anaphase-Promoting Complex/Cyclosome (APC/C) [Komagataella phaffii GS115]AOA63884.1 GQ67_03350T0 [Komagataella phaffii]AOA68328.1 GQ68_03319T0 [Komagataella phaffii GS115]CAY70335.1 Catalytic core subunit of the Anaphase-Promoting Complex/Cyclosome (APC/C) [Komagataella phaffii GS115]